jgi:hypothetical protein
MLSPDVLEAQQAIELPAREMLRRRRRGTNGGTAEGSDTTNDRAGSQGSVNDTNGENTQIALTAIIVQ